MKVPFSPPRIDDKIINEVVDTLKSGWVTTGPKTKKFEELLANYSGTSSVLAVNSATAGLELMLKWYGVKPGDEVILPSYTYCATANVVLHCGAKPVMIDIEDDFNISVDGIKNAITERTKVIMPVDIGGFPSDYEEINRIVIDKKDLFNAENKHQEELGRILILSDAAHSVGCYYQGKRSGSFTDATVFSFHAVKNLTTVEGGAICFNLPAPFDNQEIYTQLRILSLHGQSKDAFSKTKKGGWEYDVKDAGFKCNMTDVLASVGLVELERYDDETLKRRSEIFDKYTSLLSNLEWAETPVFNSDSKSSSCHVYLLRIKSVSKENRDAIMQYMYDNGIAVNIHFKPLPMLSLYKGLGYDINNYPKALDAYNREISLPVYYDLKDEDIELVVETLTEAVEKYK